jgi:DNA-binding MarR family transcriptional regulator
MTGVNEDSRAGPRAEFHDGVVPLMDLAWRTIRWAIAEHVRPRVAAEIGATEPHLRASHFRLLSLTPTGGLRLGDLANEAGMTKQALGEFVATLQDAGLLDVAVDERDRRARLVRPTALGRRVQRVIEDTFADIERRWEAEVGAPRWATFREVLTELGRFRDTEERQ